jgi:hypothetical protein
MTALQTILSSYRNDSKTEREKGTYFELPEKVSADSSPKSCLAPFSR